MMCDDVGCEDASVGNVTMGRTLLTCQCSLTLQDTGAPREVIPGHTASLNTARGAVCWLIILHLRSS
ncbi:hypothetical protein O3P69_007614 [Scylla paramamosain]|uniref:Uncharacterized protein n=1 Tax=Scylla paramamosain TaxID=85552 RepID=A0AAW0UXR2_SCYPA